jgi:1-acyl-sn-glycerol-3-phosphate acyltransferase
MTARDTHGLVRAVLFNILFYGWTLIYAVFAVPFLLAPRPVVLAVGRAWNRSVMAIIERVAGIRFQVKGRENLPAGPAIIAAKHQSAFETLALPLILYDALFVLKRELFWIPIFGWYLWRLGDIGIDRAAGPAALRAIVRQAKSVLAQGHHVIIFPQGTRVAPGSRHDYGPGVAALYTMLDVPVVPVALNSGLYWGRRRFGKIAGTVTIEFLPAIAPGLERQAFMAELQQRIEAATDRLLAQAPRPL